jgi:putative ABC transport system permease protein
MIRIFFKSLWNNRRRTILVFIELFMISLVLVNLTIYLVNMLYIFRIKNCYDTNNVILVNINKKNAEDSTLTEQSFQNLKKTFESNSFVESVSICNNAIPYNYNVHSTGFHHDDDEFFPSLREVDIDYADVMKITPLKGRWFNDTDRGKANRAIIISKEIDDKYFNGNSIGKLVEEEGENHSRIIYEIVGVVERFKRSDIESPNPFVFRFNETVKANKYWGASILIRTGENKTEKMLAIAESQVYSTLNPDNWTIESLNSLENMRDVQNYQSYQSNYLTVILALFIIVNVFLGTVGILWYNTNLRIHEIGIKRALGSPRSGIRKLFILENLTIAVVGLIIVILIMIQVPTLTRHGETEPGVLFKSIWLSTVIMSVLVLLSTWIPATIASKIRPAIALKTE